MMIKKFVLFIVMLAAPAVYADLFEGYVSPESYAVNEADLVDYKYVPASPKLDIDTLESVRFDKKVSKEFEKNIKPANNKKSEKVKKEKSVKVENKKPYEKRLSYKIAKWWVDQRYKREESHHGDKHEIKIKAREAYEKKLEEQASQAQD